MLLETPGQELDRAMRSATGPDTLADAWGAGGMRARDTVFSLIA
jgi:hypothetical protein